MRLVSYTRATSCLAGQESSSKAISEQNERIKAYANAHGWRIAKTYNDRKIDPSANEGFEQLLEDGICRSFDAVIVDSVFRAGCDFPTGRQVLLQTFHYAGIGFIVVEDGFISIGKTNREAETFFDQKNRYGMSEAIRVRKTTGYDSKRLEKKDMVYGYTLSDDQRAVPDPETAQVVKRIFKLYDQGYAKSEIAMQLSKAKIPVPMINSTCNAANHPYRWENHHINSILSQPMYSGRWIKEKYGKEWELDCDPIIPKALFDRVQIRYKTQAESPRMPHHPYVGIIEEEGKPDRIIYLRKTPKKPERYFSYVLEPSYIRLDLNDVEIALRERLNRDKEIAERLLARIQTEGKGLKTKMIEALQQEMQSTADLIITNERKKMKAYRLYQTGVLSKDEWETVRSEAREYVASMEPVFQSFQDRVREIEAAINERNPWIQARKAWNPEAALDQRTMKRFVQKIIIKQMKLKQIILTEEEWYTKLPKEWREQHGA